MKQLTHLSYLSALSIVTILTLLIYVAVQQNYRMNANDPQVQVARDVADRLEHNRSATSLVQLDTVDLSKSLAVFILYYDADKKPVAATGFLDGEIPKLPPGVLDYAKSHNEDWITWQPRKGVRLATVVKYISSPSVSYVAVGRSLYEVEIRENNLGRMIIVGWLICSVIIVFNWGWGYYRNKGKI